MAIRVSLHPTLSLLQSPEALTVSCSQASLSRQTITTSAPKFRLHAQFPAGSRIGPYHCWWIKTQGREERLVRSQSTNGIPLNGTVNGSDELPGHKFFDEAGIEPLGQGWDPWKQSTITSNARMGEGDSYARNQAGEFSGRENNIDMVSRNEVTKPSVGNEGEEPFRIMPNGKKAYLKELDVLTLLDPPPFLKPMSTMSYNHAAFLWKKIADVPEERRHLLLDLMEPKHISRMWKLAELRYEDPALFLKDPSRFLSPASGRPLDPVLWTGQVNEVDGLQVHLSHKGYSYFQAFGQNYSVQIGTIIGIRLSSMPSIVGWLSRFKKSFFFSKDRDLYGRVIAGGSLLEGLGRVMAPLYFQVTPMKIVPATNEQCDLAFSYEDGHFELKNAVPNGYPQPGRHPGPFRKQFFDYVRVVGPGVVVGQSWYGPPPARGAKDPKKAKGPQKYLGEFVLIQNYAKPSS